MLYHFSDPHFGHVKVIEYNNRPFDSIDQMDDFIVNAYNAVVKPEDSCIWYGDCFLCSMPKSRSIMARLNGKKIVVLGNHDRKPSQMMSLGFAVACYEMTIKVAGERVVCSHYPYRTESDTHHETKYRSLQPIDNGLWLIHGHTHNSNSPVKDKMINVCCELWNYAPVSQTTIERIIQGSWNGG